MTCEQYWQLFERALFAMGCVSSGLGAGFLIAMFMYRRKP